MTLAQDALNHPEIDSENVWEDCFYQFPLHPFSEGIPYCKGTWQVDGAYAVVFADNSMLLYNDSTKSFRAKKWDLEEALTESNLEENEIEEVRKNLQEMLNQK